MGRRNRTYWMLFLILLLVISMALGTSIGPVDIPLMDVLRIMLSGLPGLEGVSSGLPESSRTIVLDIRLPVVLMALFVGAGLSSSGAAMQGLFRNPLVDPFIIGISAGGAFGWVAGSLMTDGMTGQGAVILRAFIAFAGAVGAVFAAYLISRSGGRIPLANLLLAGIAVSAFLTSATQLLIYLLIDDPATLIFSLMGSCANSRWSELLIVAPVVVFGSLGLTVLGRDLNALSSGEEEAKNLGVDVERKKTLLICLAAAVSAVSVPFCGMIGFVGLIIPHIVRRVSGPDHRFLVPASALLGASFLIFSDLLSRTLIEVVIPLGIITGLAGGLFFIYLLVARRRSA